MAGSGTETLVFIVPWEAVSGPITVKSPEGSTTTSVSLEVVKRPGPIINRLFGSDLRSAPPGTEIELSGSGLESVTWMTLGDVSVAFTQSTSRLRFIVPLEARSGLLRIGISNGRVIEAGMFYVQTPADPLAQWASRGRVSESFASIAYGNGVFVAVGTEAARAGILTSRDGIAWIARPLPIASAWYGVTHGQDLFVAVGDEGRIVTSPDGNVWTRRASGVDSRLLKAAWGDAGLVVVGERGVELHSLDGVTWKAGVSGTTETLGNVTAGNRMYVAGGKSTLLIFSRDGLSWLNATVDRPYAFLSGLAYASGRFVGVGNGFTMSSTDGEHWTRQDLDDDHLYRSTALVTGRADSSRYRITAARCLHGPMASTGISETYPQLRPSRASPSATTISWPEGTRARS